MTNQADTVAVLEANAEELTRKSEAPIIVGAMSFFKSMVNRDGTGVERKYSPADHTPQ